MDFLTPLTPSKKYNKTSSLTISTPIKGQVSTCLTPCRTPITTSILSPTKNVNTDMIKSCHKSTPKSDRFIPNRSKMDFSFCNYTLFSDVGKKENEEESKNSESKNQSSNSRLKEDLFQLANHTPGKRMLSCFDTSEEEPVTPVAKVCWHLSNILSQSRESALLENHRRKSFAPFPPLHPRC